ncbi:hypothetical protein [Streptomyces sp. NPDC101149]|uniref:hypothetical protein n=1 Tax=Streptomyces sp. NPDC101149 TaxID=3366113 RepID=UPI0038184F34
MIGEERLTTDEFAGDVDYELPEPPGPKEVIEVSGGPGAESDPDRLDLDGLAARLLGRRGTDVFRIGRLLKKHDFTHGVLALLNGEPLDERGRRDRTARFGYAWARTARENPRLAVEAQRGMASTSDSSGAAPAGGGRRGPARGHDRQDAGRATHRRRTGAPPGVSPSVGVRRRPAGIALSARSATPTASASGCRARRSRYGRDV